MGTMPDQIAHLMANLDHLELWERAFVKSAARCSKLSDMQIQALGRMVDRLGAKLAKPADTVRARGPGAVVPIQTGKGNAIALQANFDIDRTRWGVNYGSGKLYERLGMHLVNDLVTLQVHVLAQ